MIYDNILKFLYYVEWLVILYFIIVNFCYVFLLSASIPDVIARFKESILGDIDYFISSDALPPVTALVPAYNEQDVIINTVQSLFKSDYPNLKIMVISDGSVDATMPLLIHNYKLVKVDAVVPVFIPTLGQVSNYYVSQTHPNLTVLDKTHSGKSDSLNIGINACLSPLFVTIDADTLLEKDAISKLTFALLSHPHTIAEGGSIYVLNGCEYKDGEMLTRETSASPIISMQICEYLRAFIFGRTGWKIFRGPLVLSGALTLFERQAVLDVGGYVRDSPGEDMEIIVNLHERMRINKFPYRIGYTFSAAAWTHVPEDMGALWAQRNRWHRGLIDSLLRHKKMFFNPWFGATGMVSYPFQFYAEFLGPIIELVGYIAVVAAIFFNLIDWNFAVLFFIASWVFAIIITVAAILISMVSFNRYGRRRELFILLVLAVVEGLGFRQILTICRVTATLRYFWVKIFKSLRQSVAW